MAIPSTSTVTQTMSYGLTGQLERVITETKNGSNVVTARTQVEYRYDASGLRCVAVDSSDSNLTTTGIERVENGRTEYLLDHNNATGYGQTLIETVKNAAGQATQRTSFTFGADEITQTVSTLNPSTGAVTATATHALGHDGHGSVRVLFDAAAAVSQVFTYSAYGEFLAIHSGAGIRTSGSAAALANPADALTKQLFNGENLDSRTGLYNFRARWYAAGSGRFERLDPFAGKPREPLGFHKYVYAADDPISRTDPSGRFFGGGTEVLMVQTINAEFNASIEGPKVVAGAEAGFFAEQMAIRATATAMTGGGSVASDAAGLFMMVFAPFIGAAIVRNVFEAEQQHQIRNIGESPIGPPSSDPPSESGCPFCYTPSPVDEMGRATLVEAIVGPVHPPGSSFRSYPIWWENKLPKDHGANWQRGHLLAQRFGGPADFGNLVALYQRTNDSGYRIVENKLAARIISGECLWMFFSPIFAGDNYYPEAVIVTVLEESPVVSEYLVINTPTGYGDFGVF